MRLDDAGSKMGVTKAFLSSLEHERREPTLSTIISYADALGIQISMLFDGCPDSTGKRFVPSIAQLRDKLKRIGFNGKNEWYYWGLLSRGTWKPDEGKPWMLSDEIVWCSLLVEHEIVGEEAKRWIHGQVVNEYNKRIGQIAIGELFGEVAGEE